MDLFNNREIATAVWLLVFVAWAMSLATVRSALAGVVRAICRMKILVAICLMAGYVAAAAACLAVFGGWTAPLVKDTIMWFCMVGMVMIVRLGSADKLDGMFKTALMDAIKVSIILEVLLNTYTLSLLGELILVPIILFLTALEAVAKTNKEHASVARLAGAALAICGFVILITALRKASHDLPALCTWVSIRSFVLAPYLTVWLIPFLYVMVLVAKYELIFVRIDLGIGKTGELKACARRRIVKHAGLRLKRVQHLLSCHAADIMQLRSENDVDRLVAEHCR